MEEALHFFLRQILYLVFRNLWATHFLWIVDLQSPDLFEVPKKASEVGEYTRHRCWGQRFIQEMTFIYRNGFAANPGYRTVANSADEFLEVAFIPNEGGGSAAIFDPQMVQKRWKHFRDHGHWRIKNI